MQPLREKLETLLEEGDLDKDMEVQDLDLVTQVLVIILDPGPQDPGHHLMEDLHLMDDGHGHQGLHQDLVVDLHLQ